MALLRSALIDDAAPLTVAVQGSITVDPTTAIPYDTMVKKDSSGKTLYVGLAPAGAAAGAAAWQVQQFNYSGNNFIGFTYVSGGAFNQVWSNYA